MAHLTLAGVSEDSRRLLLVSDAGVEFTLDVDDRLRSALRGEHARLGQLEIRMDSTLRPRDIQARIRAGESAEAVALAAQTTADRIMAFAAPVLAERQHVADRAQRSSVRRKAGETAGGARTLGDAVAAHLRSVDVDPATVEWDAWRREDGRWSLTGEFSGPDRTGTAQFSFDAPGNFVVLDNDDARWLVGDVVGTRTAPASRDDLQSRRRRLSSVPEDELPLGDDAIELVSEPAVSEEIEPEPEPEEPAPAPEEPAVAEAPADDEPQARRPVKKGRGRASVPSWDEIMFGGGKQD